MQVLCRLGRHEPRPEPIWNQGYYFTRCRRCERDLLGRFGEWKKVPRGYRVVWKRRTAEDPHWDVSIRAAGCFVSGARDAAPVNGLSDYLLAAE